MKYHESNDTARRTHIGKMHSIHKVLVVDIAGINSGQLYLFRRIRQSSQATDDSLQKILSSANRDKYYRLAQAD